MRFPKTQIKSYGTDKCKKTDLINGYSFDGIVAAENKEAAEETDSADHNVDNRDELWNHMFNDLQSGRYHNSGRRNESLVF